MYAGHVDAREDLCVRDSPPPSDYYQLTETGCVEVVQLYSGSAANSPGVKKSSDDLSLIDLELGTEADAPLLPGVGLRPFKGAVGLADFALAFVIDVGFVR